MAMMISMKNIICWVHIHVLKAEQSKFSTCMANSSSVTIEQREKETGIYRVKGNQELRKDNAEERDKLSGPLPPINAA